MGQPEEHQHLIGYEGEQRSSYREIPEDFLLYQCLLIDAMKKTFNQKLPIAKKSARAQNFFHWGRRETQTLLPAPIPGTGKGFPFPSTHPHLHSARTGTQGASPTAYVEHGRHRPTPPNTKSAEKPSHYLPKHEAVQGDPHGPDIQSLQSEESIVKSTTDSVCKVRPRPFKLLLNTFPEKIFLVSESVSGAMKAGVPTVLVKRASAPLNSLLTPKSAILTCPSSPTRRLEGLISRWIIF